MENLKYYLEKAREGKFAVAHFNFATSEQLGAIIRGFQEIYDLAKEQNKEIALMLGTSEGEVKFLGYSQARALVDAWKKDTNLPLFLNADHHKSFESCKKAIDVGYDSVLADGSRLSLEENKNLAKQVVDYMKSKNSEGIVEGELGYLEGSSTIQKEVEISRSDFTKPDEAKKFIDETNVDSLAVAVGNIHGIATNQEVELDFERLKEVVDSVPAFVVLHGGSGLTEDDFEKAIDSGIVNIHINTEVRVAYRKGIEDYLELNQNEVVPYNFLSSAVDRIAGIVKERVKLFSRL